MDDIDTRDIHAALAGDDAAFEGLVKRYEPQVGSLMWRFSRRSDEWAALVQDVFVEAFLSLRTFRGDGPFSHWLRQIAVRVGYRFWRNRAHRRPEASLTDLVGDGGAAAAVTPSKAAEILHALLARLPAADRLVLTLRYFEECSMKEIAGQTGWTVDAVKMRALRAREKLKAIAEREHVLEAIGWTR